MGARYADEAAAVAREIGDDRILTKALATRGSVHCAYGELEHETADEQALWWRLARTLTFVALGTALFVGGAAFAYLIVLPPVLAATVFKNMFHRMGFIRYMVFVNLLLADGAVAWLDVPFARLVDRLPPDGRRPLASDRAQMEHLYERRQLAYLRYREALDS